MKLDTVALDPQSSRRPRSARAAEAAGFDAIWIPEAGNDGFLPAALVAEHTEKVKMGHRGRDCVFRAAR